MTPFPAPGGQGLRLTVLEHTDCVSSPLSWGLGTLPRSMSASHAKRLRGALKSHCGRGGLTIEAFFMAIGLIHALVRGPPINNRTLPHNLACHICLPSFESCWFLCEQSERTRPDHRQTKLGPWWFLSVTVAPRFGIGPTIAASGDWCNSLEQLRRATNCVSPGACAQLRSR